MNQPIDNNGNDPTILSYADYYAWGMTMPGREYTTTPKFRLAYQNQEYESKVGMYGFSLRMYDQRLGRWFSTDPYFQHWSPYMAMSNNPVSFVDPSGGEDWPFNWDAYHEYLFTTGLPGRPINYSVYEDGVLIDPAYAGFVFRNAMNSLIRGMGIY